MGVASPLQSGKPIEYWLGGLKTSELVQLWEFLSRNLDKCVPELENTQGAAEQPLTDVFSTVPGDLPAAWKIRKHIYSESLPSSFYACKDRGGLRPSEPHKGAMGVGLYKQRKARDPPYK